jgi:hypothetical protein
VNVAIAEPMRLEAQVKAAVETLGDRLGRAMGQPADT